MYNVHGKKKIYVSIHMRTKEIKMLSAWAYVMILIICKIFNDILVLHYEVHLIIGVLVFKLHY